MLLLRLHEGLVSIVRQSKLSSDFPPLYWKQTLSCMFYLNNLQPKLASLTELHCHLAHAFSCQPLFFFTLLEHISFVFSTVWVFMRWDVLQILSGNLVNYGYFGFWKKHCFLICFYVQVLAIHLSCNLLIKAATLVQLKMPKDASYFNV